MNYEQQFLISLSFSVVIETVVLLLLVRLILRITEDRLPLSLLIFSGCVGTCLTLPYFWFVLPAYLPSYYPRVAVSELGAVLLEAGIYIALLKLKSSAALGVSFCCNACSFVLGSLLLLWL